MSDLSRRVGLASEHLVSRWNAQREAASWQALGRRRRAAARARIAMAAALAVAAVVLVVSWRGRTPTSVAAVGPASASATAVAVPEDYRVSALTKDARWSVIDRSPSRVRLRLERGSARFEVAPGRARTFEVLAGETRAVVLGTIFAVELGPDTVAVGVERGRVRFEWPDGEIVLGAGERHAVPRHREARSAATSPGAPARSAAPERGEARPGPDWRELAREGAFDRAYAALAAGERGAVGEDPDDLLLAADVARQGGHPEAAVPWLEAVIHRHAADPRAALAAFTLGRVLLDQLGQPAPAATAFARARALAPGGALAEDALAREAEARSRAGDAATAARLAQQYLDRYPGGRRANAVRRLVDSAPTAP